MNTEQGVVSFGFNDLLERVGWYRFIAGCTLLLSLCILFVVYWNSSAVEMGLLYNDLDMEVGHRIIQTLEESKVPYRLSKDGAAIYVPKEMIPRLRLRIAGDGCLGGKNVGFEMFENQSVMSSTGFVQDVQYWRAVQGELSRSINSIEGVLSSRVHIVPPRQSLFESAQEPSAAVMVRMRAGMTMNVQKVRAIQKLLTAAVPRLSIDRVSVSDDRGCVLATEDGGAASNMDFAHQAKLAAMVESVVERIVGRGNVQVMVAMDSDQDKTTEVAEVYDNENPALRSSQKRTEQSKNSQVARYTGVQEEAEATAPQPGDAAQSQQAEEVANYEVSKTVRTSVKGAGRVSRMSVAVLVNATAGKFSQDDLQEVARLVRGAVGCNEVRGDTVEVISMPFVVPEQVEEAAQPAQVKYNLFDMMPVVAVCIAMLVLVLIAVYFGKARQSVRELVPVAEVPGSLQPVVNGPQAQEVPSVKAQVDQLVAQDPKKIALLLTAWLQQEPESDDSDVE